MYIQLSKLIERNTLKSKHFIVYKIYINKNFLLFRLLNLNQHLSILDLNKRTVQGVEETFGLISVYNIYLIKISGQTSGTG